MTATHLRSLALAGLLLLAASAGAVADEAPTTFVRAPILAPGTSDLLPFSDLEQQAFNKEHGVLVYRIKSLDGKAAQLARQAAKKGTAAAQRRKLLDEARRLRIQTTALRLRLTEALQCAGVDGVLIAYMNHAPRGAGRLERYSHGLVLLLDDLAPDQRALFDRIVPQVDAAYAALTAQKERTLLALKQTKLDKPEARAVGQTFDRQLRLIDQRFWMLVDFTLDRDQRAALWKHLPTRMKRKSQAVEHLYQLPGLTPSQGARLKAAFTEMEQEASPDQATVKRIQMQSRNKKLTGKQRQALNKERSEAYKRLNDLRRYTNETTRAILSKEQWQEYLAIPPRLSTNERSGSYKRVLEGFKPSAAQTKKMHALQKTARDERRAMQKRMAEIRREGADYGPDSPEMMGMQMMMNGAKAEGASTGRKYLGAMFLDVMTPEQVTRWVMGHWGYKR